VLQGFKIDKANYSIHTSNASSLHCVDNEERIYNANCLNVVLLGHIKSSLALDFPEPVDLANDEGEVLDLLSKPKEYARKWIEPRSSCTLVKVLRGMYSDGTINHRSLPNILHAITIISIYRFSGWIYGLRAISGKSKWRKIPPRWYVITSYDTNFFVACRKLMYVIHEMVP
jgi:hypothetical protein